MKKDDLKQNYNINRQIKAVEVRVVSEEHCYASYKSTCFS